MKRAAALLLILLATLACNLAATPATVLSPTAASVETPIAPTATLRPATEAPAVSLLDSVSAERLLAEVTALSAIHSRHVNSPTIGEAAIYIHDQFTAAGGRLIVAYDEFPAVFDGVHSTQRNVTATLPGSDPAAGAIVIGAHYDSRRASLRDAIGAAPGANDNATGVAAVLELARLMAHEIPRATVMFVAFSAEEVGRQGSVHFVQQAQARGEAFRGMIALDIIGSPAGSASPEGSIRVFSAGPEGSPSRTLAHAIESQARVELPGFAILVQDAIDRPGRYSDHNSFWEAGYPAIRFIQPQEDPDNHSVFDTVDHVDPAYVRRATQAALLGLLWMLDQP